MKKPKKLTPEQRQELKERTAFSKAKKSATESARKLGIPEHNKFSYVVDRLRANGYIK